VTFDVDIKDFDYPSYVKLQTDLGLAKRFVDTGSLEPVLGEYSWVDHFSNLPYLINDKYNITEKPVRIALDLETLGLDPFNREAWIVSVSVTVEEGYAHVVHFTGKGNQPDADSELWDQINWLLNDDRIFLVGANLKFDLLWIKNKWGIECSNFKFDTTLVGSLLDENRSNSLNTHTKIYAPELGGYDDKFNQTHDKSKMHEVPKDDLLPYAGGDTDATLRVANKMITALTQSKSQTNFYAKLLHPASRAFEDMEFNGIEVDVPHFADLQVELFAEMSRLESEAMALIPQRILNKYDDVFSLTKSAIIKDFMFTHPAGLNLKPLMTTKKTEAPSTAFNHLKMFEDVPEAVEFVSILKEWTSAKKTESTYVTGFMKHLRDDGKLHPVAILFRGDYGGDSNDDSGTVTGRLAFKDPAFQTTPKHTKWAKKIRKGYIAPEDYVIVQWDYSQGELRVIACVANEETMIQTYRDGIDLHLKTGAALNGFTLEEALQMVEKEDPNIKIIRQGGKAGNFGLIYGISPEGFVIYARDTFGVILSVEQAAAQQEEFFALYPGITDYHVQYKAMAHQTGRVQSPLGRVRHLPLINSSNFGKMSQSERQSINSPIQATLSDLTQLSLSEFKKKHGNPDACKFFAMTHDSSAAYVLKDELEVWVPEVQSIMENLPIEEYFGWQPQLPFLVDPEVGPNMAELEPFVPCPF
jgi:DNA polymerase I-like protein with 3'-5' exonuclease and polymerase domains